MSEGIRTIIYPVKDLAKAKALFGGLLGRNPSVDQPYYVGYEIDRQHIGLLPSGQAGMDGPLPYVHVADIRGKLKALLDAGATSVQDVKDVGGGRLVASVRDPDGNIIGLIQG